MHPADASASIPAARNRPVPLTSWGSSSFDAAERDAPFHVPSVTRHPVEGAFSFSLETFLPFTSPTATFATTLTRSAGDVCSGGEAGERWRRKLVRNMNSDSPPGSGLADVNLLTVAEVAAAMRVSKMTVYRLVHSGELPALRVGKSFRVRQDAVNEYLRKSFYQAG